MARSQGFTLVELVIAISLIGIALLGVTYSLQYGIRYSSDPLWQTKTLSLAKAYSEEILGQPFDELSHPGQPCSPCTPADRFGPENEQRGNAINQFDDVDDYHSINEKSLNVLGEARDGYNNYQVAISVSYAGKTLGLDSDQSAKQVTLTITPPGQKAMEFVFYRGNY